MRVPRNRESLLSYDTHTGPFLKITTLSVRQHVLARRSLLLSLLLILYITKIIMCMIFSSPPKSSWGHQPEKVTMLQLVIQFRSFVGDWLTDWLGVRPRKFHHLFARIRYIRQYSVRLSSQRACCSATAAAAAAAGIVMKVHAPFLPPSSVCSAIQQYNISAAQKFSKTHPQIGSWSALRST